MVSPLVQNFYSKTRHRIKAMSNQILFTSESLIKFFDRIRLEETVDLPILGKVLISAKEIRFHADCLTLSIHHKILLVPDFEISFDRFECFGTTFSFEIGRIGIIPGFGIDALCEVFTGQLNEKLGAPFATFKENRIAIDATCFMPELLRDFSLTKIQADAAGLRVEFEF